MIAGEEPSTTPASSAASPARGALARWAAGLVRPPELDGPHRAVPHEALWLLAIVALGLIVRWLGLRLGLPYFHHWDEVLITNSARGMIIRGDDYPSTYTYGAPLMRLCALGYRAAVALGLPGSRGALLNDEVYLRVVGRAIAATLSGTGTLALYLLGRFTTRSGRAALLAALLFAVGAELVWHARFLVTDASVVTLTAWTLALTAGYARTRSLALGLAAVVLAGITFSFKLTGLATAVLPAGALALLVPRSLGDTPPAPSDAGGRALLSLAHRALLVAAVPLVFALFLFFNPHVRDQWRLAFSDWEGITRHYREGHVKPFSEREPGLEHVLSALWFLAAQALHTSQAAALALTAVALLGLSIAVRRAELVVLLGIAHAAAVVLAMALPNRAYLTRMYMPALPILCLGFGIGLDRLLDRLEHGPLAGLDTTRKHGTARTAVRWATAACAAFVASNTIYQSARCEQLSADARTRALDAAEALALAEHRTLTLAPTPALYGSLSMGGNGGLMRYLARPHIHRLDEVADARAAAGSGADLILLASHRDLKKIWPYEEQWVFTSVPGYTEVERFPYNPYEHRLELVPTWDGRSSAVLLRKQPP
jgi:hypothetical protein